MGERVSRSPPTEVIHRLTDGDANPAAELLLEVLRETPLTVWAADGAEGGYKICLWNRGAEHTYGFTPAEAIGKSYIELFVNPDERAQAIKDHEHIVSTEEEFSWSFAAEDLAKDGKIRTILGNSFRV